MRKISILVSTTVSLLAAGLAASAATTARGFASTAASGPGATFVTAPFTVGPQTLFTATILNVNVAGLNSLQTLSGNNAGAAPQGGLFVRQGGLGTNATGSIAGGLAVGFGVAGSGSGSTLSNTTSTTSTTAVGGNSLNGLSSTGISSQNITNGSSSTGLSSLNVSNGMSSQGFSSANNTPGSSSVGQNSANNAANGTSNQLTAGLSSTTVNALNSLASNGGNTKPVLVLSSLINSTNPRYGSAGAVLQGIQGTQINTVSFQFASLPTAVGQAGSTANLTPVLVIDDQANGSVNTRFLPVSAGTVSNPRNGIGLSTVSFNATQLQLQGQVQRIGLAFYQQGEVIVDNIQVNGTPSTGILAQGSQSFPF